MVEKKVKLVKGNISSKKTGGTSKVRFVMKPRTEEREFPFTDQDFQTLSDLIQKRTGIQMNAGKKDLVYGRLSRRLRALSLKSFREYIALLSSPKGQDELNSLINAVTTNLTNFFRENHHFEHLEQEIFSKIIANIKAGKTDRIRIWSAGCSSGEEPYSIAMVLDHVLKKHNLTYVDAKILATDLDTNMLNFGRKGIYREKSLDKIDPKYRSYFSPVEGQPEQFHISSSLRNYISFKQLNLIHEWPVKGPFDAIFCRNVMIYFDNARKADLAKRFSSLLKKDSCLYIGHSETILSKENNLKLLGKTIYQRT